MPGKFALLRAELVPDPVLEIKEQAELSSFIVTKKILNLFFVFQFVIFREHLLRPVLPCQINVPFLRLDTSRKDSVIIQSIFRSSFFVGGWGSGSNRGV